MNQKRLNIIESKANSLLNQYFTENELPIDVDNLATLMGLEVQKKNLEKSISGVLLKRREGPIIIVNRNHSTVRQRFTIAHEIGHYTLDHYRKDSMFVDLPKRHMSTALYRNADSSTGEILQEREANAFAAALLMPKSLIEKEISSFDSSFDQEDEYVKNIANKFKVSSQSMMFRLSNLNYFQF